MSRWSMVTVKAGLSSETRMGTGINPVGDAICIDR